MKKIYILTVVLVVLAVLAVAGAVLYPEWQASQIANTHKKQWQAELRSKNPKLLDNLVKVVGELEKSVKDNPKDQEKIIELAATYQNLGDWVNAEKWYKQALALGQDNFMIWNNLGRLYVEQGRFQDAKQVYIKMVELFPTQEESFLGFLSVYSESQKAGKSDVISKEETLYQLRQGFLKTNSAELKEKIDILSK